MTSAFHAWLSKNAIGSTGKNYPCHERGLSYSSRIDHEDTGPAPPDNYFSVESLPRALPRGESNLAPEASNHLEHCRSQCSPGACLRCRDAACIIPKTSAVPAAVDIT